MGTAPSPSRKGLPHENVYARVGPSKIEGVGVIAIRPIPKGTNIFANDQNDLRWIGKDEVERANLSEPHRRLYDDFAVVRGDRLGVPRNFNLLTTGWYLNEPPSGAEPNVAVTADLQFVAMRDIETGEELTTRYAAFSEG